MRLTQKHDFFEYVLPCQNVVGDNQATEISLGETEYTCKKYIIGEAIKELGELEDILESWHIENLEELKTRLHDCQVYHLENNSNETLIHNLKNELAELKQQLAEKDKEIEKLTEELDDKNFCKNFVDLYTENRLKTQLLHENWKDKISFALEQLEKLKVKLHIIHTNGYLKAIDEEIDDRIKELKGEE